MSENYKYCNIQELDMALLNCKNAVRQVLATRQCEPKLVIPKSDLYDLIDQLVLLVYTIFGFRLPYKTFLRTTYIARFQLRETADDNVLYYFPLGWTDIIKRTCTGIKTGFNLWSFKYRVEAITMKWYCDNIDQWIVNQQGWEEHIF